jgi:hypothetical protein
VIKQEALHTVRLKTIAEEIGWSGYQQPVGKMVKFCLGLHSENSVSVLVPAVEAWCYRVATAVIERRN